MCISQIGNRRQFNPVGIAAPSQDVSSVYNQVVNLKQQQAQPPRSPTSAVDVPAHDEKNHITVQHNYHDHSKDSRADYQEEHPARGGVTTPFPLKLHDMLEAVAADGFDHVISWQPHGRCFVVHKPKEFVELLPKYFKLSKLASFQRQLNLYGFQRLTRGRDRGGYYHELFLKNKIFLSHSIQRIKVKGTGVRARSNPDQEPDFWAMPWVENNVAPTAQPPMMEDFLQSSLSQLAAAQLPQHLAQPMPQPMPSIFQMPEAQKPEKAAAPSDFVIDSFGKSFHYLDPFQQAQQIPLEDWATKGVDDLLVSEAESFFDGFDFPESIGEEIEDDDVFGDMLEQMIA